MVSTHVWRNSRGEVISTDFDFREIRNDRTMTLAHARELVYREAICGLHTGGANGPGSDQAPTSDEVTSIKDNATAAFTSGRVLDFGNISDVVIRSTAPRAAEVYMVGALPHPFSEPYVLAHKWEEGLSLYLVQTDAPSDPCGSFEAVEFYPMVVRNVQILGIGDRVLFSHVSRVGDGLKWNALPIPNPLRFDPMFARFIESNDPNGSAIQNCIDPIMALLMIFHTDGLSHQRIEVKPSLNRARSLKGKFPIGGHTAIRTEAYVTAIRARGERGESRTPAVGTHASPIAHIRRGHFRQLPSGRRTFVRDTIVNASPDSREAFRSRRSHYEVKPSGDGA